MRKVLSIIVIISLIFAVNVNAAEIVYSEYKTGGTITASVSGIEEGDKVRAGVFNENDELVRASSAVSEGESVPPSADRSWIPAPMTSATAGSTGIPPASI